ncbi:MAG: cupredoxin domain-containing protein [Patescibacteria group bacterium]
MSKKTYLWLAVAVIVVIAAIYVLVSLNSQGLNGEYADQGQAQTLNNNLIPTGNEAAALKQGDVIPGYATDSNSIEQAPIIITAEAKSFSPTAVTAKLNSKITFILEATDDATHSLSFSSKQFGYIQDVNFSKASGRKSITFPGNIAGSFNFYIDQESNKGTLVVK